MFILKNKNKKIIKDIVQKLKIKNPKNYTLPALIAWKVGILDPYFQKHMKNQSGFSKSAYFNLIENYMTNETTSSLFRSLTVDGWFEKNKDYFNLILEKS